MKVVTNKNASLAQGRGGDSFKVKQMAVGSEVRARILQGVQDKYCYWWPTVVEDQNSGVVKNTWRNAYVDGNAKTPLDHLADLDRAFKQKLTEASGGNPTEVRSMFDKEMTYDYAAIIRGSSTGKADSIQILKTNWSVMNRINQIQHMLSGVSKDYLEYGLIYMYDIIIRKSTNPKNGRNQYTVDPEIQTCAHTAGKVHIAYIDQDRNPLDPNQYLSAEDQQLVAACNWDLDTIEQPIPVAQLMDRLRQYPINLAARQRNNPSRFLFFQSRQELETLQKVMALESIAFLLPQDNEIASLPSHVGTNEPMRQALNAPAAGSAAAIVAPAMLPPPGPTPAKAQTTPPPPPNTVPVYAPAPAQVYAPPPATNADGSPVGPAQAVPPVNPATVSAPAPTQYAPPPPPPPAPSAAPPVPPPAAAPGTQAAAGQPNYQVKW